MVFEKQFPSLSRARRTIAGNYASCLRKMELYRGGVQYGTTEWTKLTSHQKVYVRGEDRFSAIPIVIPIPAKHPPRRNPLLHF